MNWIAALVLCAWAPQERLIEIEIPDEEYGVQCSDDDASQEQHNMVHDLGASTNDGANDPNAHGTENDIHIAVPTDPDAPAGQLVRTATMSTGITEILANDPANEGNAAVDATLVPTPSHFFGSDEEDGYSSSSSDDINEISPDQASTSQEFDGKHAHRPENESTEDCVGGDTSDADTFHVETTPGANVQLSEVGFHAADMEHDTADVVETSFPSHVESEAEDSFVDSTPAVNSSQAMEFLIPDETLRKSGVVCSYLLYLYNMTT